MDLKFSHKQLESKDIFSFFFSKPGGFRFDPGDYVELTLPSGEKRWLTIASAPHEEHIRFTTKLSKSEFKLQLSELGAGEKVSISPAIGSFNLPHDLQKRVIFVAGGLGVTPFRSMIVDMKKRQIIFKYDLNMIYAAKTEGHIFEKDLRDRQIKLQLTSSRPEIDDIQNLPKWDESLIYLSGSQPVCEKLYKSLLGIGVSRAQIKLCYFPGYMDI